MILIRCTDLHLYQSNIPTYKLDELLLFRDILLNPKRTGYPFIS